MGIANVHASARTRAVSRSLAKRSASTKAIAARSVIPMVRVSTTAAKSAPNPIAAPRVSGFAARVPCTMSAANARTM